MSKPVAGLIIPSGLTFNPDGQAIYYTIAAIFIARATNTPLTLTDQLIVLAVLMFTSKGSAGFTGVGTMAIAKWVGALDTVKMHKALNGELEEEKSATVQAEVVAAHSARGTGAVLPSRPGWSSLSASTNVTVARCTTRSCCSMPTAR